MAIAGAQMYGTSAASEIGDLDRVSKNRNVSLTVNGPEGRSAVFHLYSHSLTSYTGTIAFTNFVIEYEEAEYTLNGSYSLDFLGRWRSGDSIGVTLTHVASGTVSIAKGSSAAYDYMVATTTNTTYSMTQNAGCIRSTSITR
jgi:hypothetical protein